MGTFADPILVAVLSSSGVTVDGGGSEGGGYRTLIFEVAVILSFLVVSGGIQCISALGLVKAGVGPWKSHVTAFSGVWS